MSQRKKVTSTDVAALAGVSQSTVSMILSKSDRMTFSQETVERVVDAAEKLGYTRKKTKQQLSDQSKYIAVICPGMMNPYYTMLIEAVQETCAKAGYGIFTISTLRLRSEEERMLGLLAHTPVSGVIYTYFTPSTDIAQQICTLLPTVIIGDKDSTIEADAVELNSIKSGAIMAEHLLGLGHRRIAFISTPLGSKQLARCRRLQGMQMKFKEHGITDGIVVKTRENVKVEEPINMFTEYSAGYDMTRELLQQNEEVTAIAGLNDMFAFGIMDALLDEKLRIPQDYSVIGCDNTVTSRLRRISLTTVEHYVTTKGRQAVELLLRKITAPDSGDGMPPSIMRVEYEPRIVARDSTGICRSKRR